MKSTPLKNKRGKTGMYFTSETEEWIVKYVNETDSIKKDIIIRNYLYKPIKKLCEIYYNKLSLPYLQRDNTDRDLQNDCFAHLITNSVYKFKGGKGKAFSYLSIAARNHYIQANKRAQVLYNAKQHSLIECNDDIEDNEEERLQYNEEFRKMYYGYIQWVRDNIDELHFIKPIKILMLKLLDFMDDFDEIEHYFKLEVNNALRRRYKVTDSTLKTAKDKLTAIWLQYKSAMQKGEEFSPNFIWNTSIDELPEDVIDYILKHYKPVSHQNSANVLSVKLGLPRHLVWEVLKIHGLRPCD